MEIDRRKRKYLVDNIRMILLTNWDPLNVGQNPMLKDEYDRYITEIYHLVSVKSQKNIIENALERIESQELGLECNRQRISTTATRLAALEF